MVTQKIYVANRLFSKGNLLFPNKVIVDTANKTFSFYKRNSIGIGYQEMTIRFKDIVSVGVHQRNEILIYSSIIIESKGGKILEINGLNPNDVNEIKTIIEFYNI